MKKKVKEESKKERKEENPETILIQKIINQLLTIRKEVNDMISGLENIRKE